MGWHRTQTWALEVSLGWEEPPSALTLEGASVVGQKAFEEF